MPAETISIPTSRGHSLSSSLELDHLLTDSADADYVAGVIAVWASRYM